MGSGVPSAPLPLSNEVQSDMAKQKSDVYIVRRSFSPDGRRVMRRGTRVLASDPTYKANRSMFVLADADLFDDIEQATAAPGEKRNAPTKSELLKAADELGADVPATATKAEISDAIAETIEY